MGDFDFEHLLTTRYTRRAPRARVPTYLQTELDVSPEVRMAWRQDLLQATNLISGRCSTPATMYNEITGTFGIDRSAVSADNECVHGRLPGDPCPQPATVPSGQYALTRSRFPNLDRLWDKPYPCECWGEPRVLGLPFEAPSNGSSRPGKPRRKESGITRATVSHDAVPDPVGRPRSPV